MHLHEDSEPVEVVATRNCRHCGVPFISNRALAIHCRNFHGETLGFSCNLCRKQFVTRQYLNLHVRTHKIGDRFYCSGILLLYFEYPVVLDCGHWYRSVEELSKHKECCKCAEQGSYSCEFCPKTFKYPKDKVLHERTHTGIKVGCRYSSYLNVPLQPFTCKYCDARFSQTSALKVHTRIHTNERPHKCRFCPADFTDRLDTSELKFNFEQFLSSSATRKHELKFHYKECQETTRTNRWIWQLNKIHINNLKTINSGGRRLISKILCLLFWRFGLLNLVR